MIKRIVTLLLAMGFASVCAIQAQSPTPGESPAKHRGRKKAETTAAAGETAASPSPGESPSGAPKTKRGRKKTEASPAQSTAPAPEASPKAKGGRKKTTAATSPSPSPGKFSLGDLFKPKTSAAATPAPASNASAKKASGSAGTNPPAPGGGHGLVWVNTDSHVYHREGSRFYGTTKKGKYMTEAEAVKEGDRAAGKGE
ncbi:MAG TPA: hypothetical protein VFQ83_12065 [Candidatus Udaeobacter sp.]|jgi:hypothetical protein|nr:hypothetical protein [Candidatus Udaeobacter sp.]